MYFCYDHQPSRVSNHRVINSLCLGLFVSNKHCPSIHFIYSDLTAWMLMKYWSPELSFPHTLDLVKPIRFKWYFYKCDFLLGFQLHGWSCTSCLQPSSCWSPSPWPVWFEKALQFSLLYLLWFHCMDVYEVPNQASYTHWTWVNWLNSSDTSTSIVFDFFPHPFSVVDWFNWQWNGKLAFWFIF